jgi:hypothetical protein
VARPQGITSLKIKEIIKKVFGKESNLVLLMIIGKIITRGSKLGIVNWIKRNEYIATAPPAKT